MSKQILVKLDLHCHSIASDGAWSIWKLAELAKTVGLGALVITDHCSPNNAFDTNQVVLDTIKELDLTLPVPVILGSEIKTPYGEFLLFGKKACKQWDQWKNELKSIGSVFGIEQYWEMFNRFVLHKLTCWKNDAGNILKINPVAPLSYALVMCHPQKDISWYRSLPECFWKVLNGFEIQNGVVDYGYLKPDVVEYLRAKIPNCKAVRNSDCHGDELGSVFNEIELKGEISENQLIHWFRK